MSENRQLATIEKIVEVAPIPDAEHIERVRVRGWDVVAKKGTFKPNDPCVYFEIDSLLDVEDERFAFLAARGVRTDATGRKGHVLKTAKLRGQYSQGLALPLAEFPEAEGRPHGSDLTETLGVVKWEPPIPASLAGAIRGQRPGWIRATDEERIQNIPYIIDEALEYDWFATEKIDGTSETIYVDQNGLEGVCSRNLDLLPAEGNTLWKLAREYDIHRRIIEQWPGKPVAVQGEAYGEGIQANPLKIKGQRFAAFTLYVEGRELPVREWPSWLLDIAVPAYPYRVFPQSVEDAVQTTDGIKSLINRQVKAEGIVWRVYDTATITLRDGRRERASFKVISNSYLLKHDT